MVFLRSPLCVLSAVLAATALAVPRAAHPRHGFHRRWLAPREAPIKLHIALRQDDGGAAIERQLFQASDPSSAAFRQHLSSDRAISLSPPAHGSVRAVEFWLQQHGLSKEASLSGGIIEVDTTIHHAEQLLNTTYFVYSDGAQDVTRTELYHIPQEAASYVDFVTPTTSFPRQAVERLEPELQRSITNRARSPAQKRDTCGPDGFTTPTCVRRAYGINYTARPDQTLPAFAVYATEGASFDPDDLQTYLERYNKPAAAAQATYQVIGTGDPANKGGIGSRFETALDTQAFLGVAWPAKGVLYNYGGVFGPNAGHTYDHFVSFLNMLITNETVPHVVSFSESMPENRMDPAYAKRLCNMMAQVGTRGVTLLFSSGNNGPNGDQPTGKHSAIFEPEFPASCPYVTAVGGTTNPAEEQAATKSTIPLTNRVSFTASGGGFSNLFSRPGWQQSAVTSYISNHVPSSYASESGFNRNGRGIPDVAAFSTNFPVVVDYITAPVGGTSAATPTWAAVIALLNDYEASKSRPPLGFINPWLYNLTSGLKDITKGGNSAGECYFLAGCKLPRTLGYDVAPGWDAVTGLGSPIFHELTAALDALAA